MKHINYQCNTCGKECHLEIDEEAILRIRLWLSMARCNRCADYFNSLDRIMKKIREAAFYYSLEQRRKQKAPEVLKAAREAMVKHTKALAKSVCGYYNVVYTWEPDFSEQCMEHPDKITEVVNTYIRMIKAKVRPQAILSSDHHRTADIK